MNRGPNIAAVAALVGDPSRAIMLDVLLDGRVRTAGELAREANVTPATASGHLAKLVDGDLLAVAHQGRHRYFRLASAEAAHLLESLAVFAGERRVPKTPRFPKDDAMRTGRTCYDHLAGRLGVALADGLVASGYLDRLDDGFAITTDGGARFARAGLDMAVLQARSRPLIRGCVDWSERRFHLAGSLGAGLLDLMTTRHWLRRADGRTVVVTPSGHRGLAEAFGVTLG
ncbi:MAG: helix-turn-helix transcriptional regulator [Alphaproteobacteria bacterium]|nr:helix-turn-helix transcriptional regulator [Alphaproteobacteria bacterium]